MNMAFSFLTDLKEKLSQNKAWFLIIILFLFTNWSNVQPDKTKVDISKLYEISLGKNLFPSCDSLMSNEIVRFVALPTIEPEYSLRIIESGNQSFIESRFLEKKLWDELFSYIKMNDNKPLFLKVDIFSAPVNKIFKTEMLNICSKLILNIKKKNDPLCIYDGITYDLKINEEGKDRKNSILYELNKNDFEYPIVQLFIQMANDLKNHSFDEAKYLNKLK